MESWETGAFRGSHGHAAIDRDDLTGDVACCGAGDEGDGFSDVLGVAKGGEGDFSDDGLLDRLGQFVGHVGGDESRSDRIAGDLAACEFAGDRFGETDETGFRS